MRTVTTAIGLFASTELTLQRVLLPPVCLLPSTLIDRLWLAIFVVPEIFFCIVLPGIAVIE